MLSLLRISSANVTSCTWNKYLFIITILKKGEFNGKKTSNLVDLMVAKITAENNNTNKWLHYGQMGNKVNFFLKNGIINTINYPGKYFLVNFCYFLAISARPCCPLLELLKSNPRFSSSIIYFWVWYFLVWDMDQIKAFDKIILKLK